MGKSRKPKKNEEEILVDIVEAKEAAQSFFEKNQMKILGAVGLVLLLIAGYLIYKIVYQEPREKTAMAQMYKAEYQFQRDSFALALESPGAGFDGFLDIIDNYSGTKAANLAKYYTGISYLNLNRYDDALTYLESYKPSGNVTTITKYGAMGDAASEKQDMEKALSYYQKAASGPKNSELSPYYLNKAGLLARTLGKNDVALKAFERISADFPGSAEAVDASKYISLLK